MDSNRDAKMGKQILIEAVIVKTGNVDGRSDGQNWKH